MYVCRWSGLSPLSTYLHHVFLYGYLWMATNILLDVEYAVTGSSSSGKNRTSRSKSKPSKNSSGKGKGPAQEDIDEVDERDHQGYESRYSQNRSAAPQAEQMCKCLSEASVYRWHRPGSQSSLDWDPTTQQYYPYTQAGQGRQGPPI